VALKTFKLRNAANSFDPTFIAKVRSGFDGKAVVSLDGSIDLLGTKLLFSDESDSLNPGTTVNVWLDHHFTCASLSDIEAHQREREEAQFVKRESDRARRNAQREEAASFNTALSQKIPARWCPGVKMVASGLSANSWGDGRSRATVEHVYLLDDLNVGRLKRREGDFLCQNSKTRLGGLDPRSLWVDGDGMAFEPKVTCKVCLAIAERLAK